MPKLEIYSKYLNFHFPGNPWNVTFLMIAATTAIVTKTANCHDLTDRPVPLFIRIFFGRCRYRYINTSPSHHESFRWGGFYKNSGLTLFLYMIFLLCHKKSVKWLSVNFSSNFNILIIRQFVFVNQSVKI